MHRFALPLAICCAGSLVGCSANDPAPFSDPPGGHGGSGGSGSNRPPVDAGIDAPPPDAGPCVNDLVFRSDLHRLARGGKTAIPMITTLPFGSWQLGVVDPTIASVSEDDFGLEIEALAPGSTTIVALRCGRATTYDITVVPAAAIEVRVTQSFGGRSDPVTHLTAIAGSTDVLEVSYLDAAGGVLAGQGAATYTYEGGVGHGDHTIAQLQLGEAEAVPRDFPVFSFAAAGRIIARGDFGSVAIDVAVTPQPDHIAIASFSFAIFFGAAVVGQTASGEPLAGVTASWEVAPKDNFVVNPPLAGTREITMYADHPVTPFVPPTVTAQVGSLTATATIVPDDL
jgi:hypothetical protein